MLTYTELSGATGSGWEVLLAVLAEPKVGGKSEDDQAK